MNVYLSMSALGNLFITPDEVIRILSGQNTLVGSGEKMAGQMQIKIIETGTYKNLDDIRNQILTSTQGLQVRLGDIARIEAGYAEPPGTLMRVNGRRAIGIGVSTDPEKDVVKTGALIERKLAELNPQIPIGITLQTLYPENQIAREANNTFIVNLIESISIVIVLIMLIMGLRAGILIGSSLIFAIGGTLLIMQFLGVGLNRTSLAGFIIAMGMLVDNAIVVTDNAQKRDPARRATTAGADRRSHRPQWGLLGATFIAICSFLPLYLAPSAVAEIVKPLFVVVAISLLLSLGARAEPNPAIWQLHSERTNAGGSARPLRSEILPPVRPVARTADPPALVGRGDHGRAVRRVAAGHGSHAAKFFPEPRQALFSGRLFPARRLQYPGYGTEHNAARRVVVTATVR